MTLGFSKKQFDTERSKMSPALIRDIKARTGFDKMLEIGNKKVKGAKHKALKNKKEPYTTLTEKAQDYEKYGHMAKYKKYHK